MTYKMRSPCVACAEETGEIVPRNGQDCVFCAGCRRFAYNAPRVETSRAVRSVSTVHDGIKPKQRVRILLRAAGRCELCGAGGFLHVGHLLSADDGLEAGLTEMELNDDTNLAALCEVCNLGMGSLSIPPVLFVALLRRWKARAG